MGLAIQISELLRTPQLSTAFFRFSAAMNAGPRTAVGPGDFGATPPGIGAIASAATEGPRAERTSAIPVFQAPISSNDHTDWMPQARATRSKSTRLCSTPAVAGVG